MPQFTVNYEGFASLTITVDADDVDDAIEKAGIVIDDNSAGSLCIQCSGYTSGTYGEGGSFSLDITEDWEVATKEDGTPSVNEKHSGSSDGS